MIQENITDKVKKVVLSIDNQATIILYGSRSRGDSSGDSDWDFLILVDSLVDEKLKSKIRNTLVDTEIEIGESISTLIYSKDQWQNYKVTPLYYYNK